MYHFHPTHGMKYVEFTALTAAFTNGELAIFFCCLF